MTAEELGTVPPGGGYAFGRNSGGRGYANRGGSPEIPYHDPLVLEDGLCTECGRTRYRPAERPRSEPGPFYRCKPPSSAPAPEGLPELPEIKGTMIMIGPPFHEPIKKDSLGLEAPLPGSEDYNFISEEKVEPYGQCVGCGVALYPTGRPGRRSTKCPDCRAGKLLEVDLPDITPPEPGVRWSGCRGCGVPILKEPGARGRPRAYCHLCLEADT